MECNRKWGRRMIVHSNNTNISSLPTPHSHPEESLDDLIMEKIRQKMKNAEKRPNSKLEKCFRQRSGRKSEITGSRLQISKKQSKPNEDKKVNLFNLQFIINYFNNSPFHYLSTPRPFFVHPLSHPPPNRCFVKWISKRNPRKKHCFLSTENEIMDLLREYYKIRKQLSEGGRGALITNSKKLRPTSSIPSHFLFTPPNHCHPFIHPL